MSLYLRQTLLPEIGTKGQELLRSSKVLIVGVGGLGCPAALYLAGAGVGTLGLIDDDKVSLSNLHRQILFTHADVGASKAVVAQKRLAAFNPTLRVEAITERLTAANTLNLMQDFDLVIDGTDNFPAKFLINDGAAKLEIPVVYGAISQFEGQVAVFSAKRHACYRCFRPKPPLHYVPNCAEAGVLGSVAGLVGTLQATEALKCLLSAHTPSLCPQFGKLYIVNTKTMEFSAFQISKNRECPVCSRPPDQIVIKEETMDHCSTGCQCSQLASKQEIDTEALLRDDYFKRCQLIDVRTQEEWDEGHIASALHWPLSRIEGGELPPFASDKPRILYCRSGGRSSRALTLLAEKGIKDVSHLKQGFLSWKGPVAL